MAEDNKQKLYAKYLGKTSTVLDSPVAASIHEGFLKANTKVLRLSRYESSAFDTTWISVIEDILFDLGEIINAPKLVTVEEGNIVPVELAKKIKGESVQHLASHTQYIKDVDERNNVIPSKIMSFSNEDWLYTYENRFIATFVRRLMLFIEKRYEFIEQYIPLHKEEAMVIRSKTKIDGAEVEIESKIKVTALSEDPEADAARRAAERIETVRTYIMYYFGSPFMQKMKTERDVRKPIIMTNILRKNPKYHRCYEAFMFVDKYDSLGMDYHSQEYFHPLTEKEGEDLAWLLYHQYLALNDNTDVKAFKSRKKDVHPKVVTSIDDEEFVYGRIPSTRLEFVRIDQDYQDYLDRKAGKILPKNPSRPERDFYAEDYYKRFEALADLNEINKLIRRKHAAVSAFEAVIEEIIRKREEEDALLRQMEEEERLSDEEALLNKKREEIERAAKGLSGDEKEEPESEGVVKSEEFVAEVPTYTGEPLVVTFSSVASAKDNATFASPVEPSEEEEEADFDEDEDFDEEENEEEIEASAENEEALAENGEGSESFAEGEEAQGEKALSEEESLASSEAQENAEAAEEGAASSEESAESAEDISAYTGESTERALSEGLSTEEEGQTAGATSEGGSTSEASQEAGTTAEAGAASESAQGAGALKSGTMAGVSAGEPKEAGVMAGTAAGGAAASEGSEVVLAGGIAAEGEEGESLKEMPSDLPVVSAPRKIIKIRSRGRFLRKKKEFRDETYGQGKLPLNPKELEALEEAKKEAGIEGNDNIDVEVVFHDAEMEKAGVSTLILDENSAELPPMVQYQEDGTGSGAALSAALQAEGEEEASINEPSSNVPVVSLPRKVIKVQGRGRFLRKKKEYRDETYGQKELPLNPLELEDLAKAKKEAGIEDEEVDVKLIFGEEKIVEEPVSEPVSEPTIEEITAEPAPIEEKAEEMQAEVVKEKPIEEAVEPLEEKKEEAVSEEILEEEAPLALEEKAEEPVEEPVLETPEEIPAEPAPIEEKPVGEPIEEPLEEAALKEATLEVPEGKLLEKEPTEEKAVEPEPKGEIKEEPKEEPKQAPIEEKPAAKAKKTEKPKAKATKNKPESKETDAKPFKPAVSKDHVIQPTFDLSGDSSPYTFSTATSSLGFGQEKKEKGENSGKQSFVPSNNPSSFAGPSGSFIVKCPEGYYVSEGVFNKDKAYAYVFTDFDKALKQKRRYGGKVIKL